MPPVQIQTAFVEPLTATTLLDRVAGLIAAGAPATVSYVNVQVLNVAAGDPALADFLGALDLCYADGNGVVLAARLLGGHLPGRMTGADWMDDLAARASHEGWRVAWIGGAPGVTDRAAQAMRERHPLVQFVCTEHGFHPTEGAPHDALLARLAEARADIVLVGMGTPLQERWVAANRVKIAVPVVWCVGAMADFVSGEVSRGPAFLVEKHEWLARLLVDPRRLWRRFLLGNPRFLARVLRSRLRR